MMNRPLISLNLACVTRYWPIAEYGYVWYVEFHDWTHVIVLENWEEEIDTYDHGDSFAHIEGNFIIEPEESVHE